MIDTLLLKLFIKIGTRWFGNIMVTTDRETDRASTIIFSTKYYTIDKISRYMKKESIV